MRKLADKILFEPTREQYTKPTDYKIVPTESFISSGKESLHAWHFRAKHPRALLLQFHGNAENITSHAPYVGWLAEYDVDVFTFDYAGFGKSSGKTSIEQAYLDCASAIRHCSEICERENLKLIVLCQSIGSQFGLPSVVSSTSLIQPSLVIFEGGFPAVRDLSAHMIAKMTKSSLLGRVVSKIVPESVKIVDACRELQHPSLVIHSKNDQVVPLELGRKLSSNLQREKTSFWEVSGPLHLKALTEDFPEFRKKLLDAIHASIG